LYQGCTVTKTSHLPIRYFLALLWAHPILHISTIRVKMKAQCFLQCQKLKTHWCSVITHNTIVLHVNNHTNVLATCRKTNTNWFITQAPFHSSWPKNANFKKRSLQITNLTHNFLCMFISILYMFWAATWPSHNLHTRRSSTQRDINQVSHWYNNSPDDGHMAARNM